MTEHVRRCKYFIPELPPQYIPDFSQDSRTAEAVLLRLLLQSDASSSRAPAIMVKGAAGTGKTTTLMGVGKEVKGMQRFSDAVWFVSLGKDARPSALLEDLETVVRAVVGIAEADEIGRLSTKQKESKCHVRGGSGTK